VAPPVGAVKKITGGFWGGFCCCLVDGTFAVFFSETETEMEMIAWDHTSSGPLSFKTSLSTNDIMSKEPQENCNPARNTSTVPHTLHLMRTDPGFISSIID